MDINTGTLVNGSTTYTPPKAIGSGNTDVKLETKPELVADSVTMNSSEDREISKEDVDKTTGAMNKIMQLLNANLKFVLHDKTQRLMVQLVDIKENKVLKEFPPHQLLDTLAAIREYVGILLDKKV